MKRIIVLVLILSIPSSGISQQLASNSRLLVNEQLSLKDGISLTSASFAKVPSPMEFEEFLDEYKMTKKFYEMEANVLGFGTYTSKTVVSVGIGATSLLGVPPPIAALGGVVAADAIQMLGDKIESQLFSALNAQFENGLLLYRATHSQREIEMLTGQSTEEVYRAVYGSSKIFSLQNEFELKDQEKEDYQKFVLQVLADKVAKIEWSEFARNKETRDLGLEIADLEMEISKNGKKLKGLTRLYREFVVGTYSHISQVDKNTVEVLKDTRELILRSQNLSADIQQNRDQVEFIQEFFYGKMTSEEQLKALERGWLPSLQGADRSKSIEMLQKRSQIEEIWGNVDKAFSALPLLARTLRLDPETIQGIDKSSMLVRSGISIASSLASQNYFSAAMSFLGLVGGLFGPKHDPDKPARMRHDQIMRAFGTVIENQELIYSGIKSLAEGQKQIFEVQKATFEGLVKVSRQITELHLDMQKRLNGIKAYEVRNIELARSLLLQDVSSCFGFLKKSEGDLGKTLLVSKLKGLDQLTQHFRFYGDLFTRCIAGLETVLSWQEGNSVVHPLLLVKNYLDEYHSSSVDHYIEEIYRPSYLYLAKIKGEEPYLSDSLMTYQIAKYSHLILELHSYYQMIESVSNPKVFSIAELKSGRGANQKRGLKMLNSALKLIDTAIAQQEMLAGEGILDQIYDELSHPETAQHAFDTMKFNPILQRNMALKVIKMGLHSSGKSEFFYDHLMRMNSSSYFLRELVSHKWEFVLVNGQLDRDNANWSWLVKDPSGVQDGRTDLVVPLPSFERLKENRLVYFEDLNQLHSIRAKVIEAIMEYRVLAETKGDIRNLLIKSLAN